MKTNLFRKIQRLLLVSVISLTTVDARAAAASTWTKGHRKVLVIPVRFNDAAAPSNSDPNGFTGWTAFTNGTLQAEVNNFFLKQSYNQFSVEFTILPAVNLGVPTTYYTNKLPGSPNTKWTDWGAPGSLADDARAAARAIGLTNGMAAMYESANYDMDIIATGYITNRSGAASDGARSILAFNYFTAMPHEMGHCLGLQHANGLSRPTYDSPVNRGSPPYSYFYDPYGDVYCVMGWKEGTRTATPDADRDVSVYYKYELGWLTDEFITSPGTTSGTYRVHAFDQGTLDSGKRYALRIPRDENYTYWFSFRQAITNLPDSKWSQHGLEVRFGADSPRATSGTTQLFDMTPDSRGPTNATFATMHDAPLQIGRTYSDAEANLHVTPIKKGGTTPESLDVVANFGPFPSNQSPTVSISPATVSLSSNIAHVFTATASDPDGDTLAYYWEFDDATKSGGTDFGGLDADSRSATQAVHSWTQKGEWLVRCTVTDMKGGKRTASAMVVVTNGSPSQLTISGVVLDELGNPLQDAIVNNFRAGIAFGATNFAGSSETAADGRYRITLTRTNTTYKLFAMNEGFQFTNSIGGTVNVFNASVSNVNFTRVRKTRSLSGGVYVAGRGYNSATDGLLTVSDGSQSTIVSNGGWQLNVPDGTLITLTATPTNPAYTVTSFFPKPYSVVNDCITLSFLVDIPGGMPLTGFTSPGTNSDDTVGTVGIPIVLTPPPGMTNWNGQQAFRYSIDNSSTAEYGVDYKMNSGSVTFPAGYAPVPYIIPLTIFQNGIPKSKTIVIKLLPGNSIANIGPISTFTYTISNPVPTSHLANANISGNLITFTVTNLNAYVTNRILRTHDLLAPNWATAHTFSGISGMTNWAEPFSNEWGRVFYRIQSE